MYFLKNRFKIMEKQDQRYFNLKLGELKQCFKSKASKNFSQKSVKELSPTNWQKIFKFLLEKIVKKMSKNQQMRSTRKKSTLYVMPIWTQRSFAWPNLNSQFPLVCSNLKGSEAASSDDFPWWPQIFRWWALIQQLTLCH